MSDRKILTNEEIQENADGIENDIRQVFNNFEEEIFNNKDKKQLSKLKILRNHEWYKNTNIIDFCTTSARSFRMSFLLSEEVN